MQRRISEAIVTLNGMVSTESFSSIEEGERIEFENRVETLAKNWCLLSCRTWLPSPREIARYGWKLVNPTTLECKTCHMKLLIREEGLCIAGNNNADGHLLKEFIQFNNMEFDLKLKQIGMLRYSHKSYCSFALIEIPLQYENIYASPDILQSFPDISVSSPPAIYCFQYYLSVLEANKTYSLPNLADQTLQAIDKALQRRSQLSNGENQNLNFTGNPTVTFALTGWKLIELNHLSTTMSMGSLLNKREHSDLRYTLVCDWCHRTVGNWNFQSSDEDQQNIKRQKTMEGTGGNALPCFDALGQHLEFCPWAHHIEGEPSGWKQVLDFYCIPIREDYTLSLKAEEGYHKLLVALNGS